MTSTLSPKIIKPNMKLITKLSRLTAVTLILLAVVSCTSYKEVPYFQNIDQTTLSATQALYDAKIMPKDILTITVNTTDPQVSSPFNLVAQTPNAANLTSSTTQATLQQYQVNNNGEIDFPVLGVLKVGGLTKNQAEAMIREKLKPYIKEVPVVTVRMIDFKISVIGEVNRPGQFTISKEKVNILEALALAGDMTVYGIRNDVILIRENAQGEKQYHHLNLLDASVIESPYYQMQQNDILYVKPNKTKAKNSDIGSSTTLWFSATSIMVSLASLLYNILK
jgi:polysaccharide export outer membrane protein